MCVGMSSVCVGWGSGLGIGNRPWGLLFSTVRQKRRRRNDKDRTINTNTYKDKHSGKNQRQRGVQSVSHSFKHLKSHRNFSSRTAQKNSIVVQFVYFSAFLVGQTVPKCPLPVANACRTTARSAKTSSHGRPRGSKILPKTTSNETWTSSKKMWRACSPW
jgi:hypothetical protein